MNKLVSAQKHHEEINALNLKIEALDAQLKNRHNRTSEAESEARGARAEADEMRKQFVDLKERLHNSEMECSRLSGYMSRVREDDTVREDLITVGEPGVNEQLVPKRKTGYPPMMAYPGMADELYNSTDAYGRAITRKPKHWVNY